MDRLYLVQATTQPGVLSTAPTSTPVALEDASLRDLRIIIPDGHNGFTGIRIVQASQQIIPFANNSFLVGNNRVIDIPFDDYITVSGLVIQTYNTGIYVHSHYVEMTIVDTPLRADLTAIAVGHPLALPNTPPLTPDPLSPAVLIASVAGQDGLNVQDNLIMDGAPIA